MLVVPPMPAAAQDVRRGTAVIDLPRPGYEPRRLRFGALIVSPELITDARYDSNVYATSTDEDDDILFTILPRISAEVGDEKLRLRSEAYVAYRAYSENGNENSTTFGGAADINYAMNRRHTLSAGARFDRAAESRTDPETNRLRVKPVKLDSLSGNLGYRFRSNRFGLTARFEAQDMDYHPAADRDRDHVSYRGSLRASLQASPRFDLFVEGYANRRDHDLRLDRNGIDRDAKTFGILGGTTVDIADRWQGQIGVGAFRANPDDPTLRSFSGLAVNGNLTWWPDVRNSLTLAVSRGDVATVRAGASGRIDTRASLQYEQEVRHNILIRATPAFRETRYRGTDRRLRQASFDGEIEYLVTNQISVVASAGYARRTANDIRDRFERVVAGLGIRFRY